MPPYENTVPEHVLMDLMKREPGSARAWRSATTASGRRAARPTSATSRGVVPGVEARIAITESWDVPGHSIEFEKAAGTDRAGRRCWRRPRGWR